jgi:flagellar basal body-associated protein FliL
MTDPIVPGGAGLPEQQSSPADPSQSPAEPAAPTTPPVPDAGSAWSTSAAAPEPATPADAGAGFGMPTGGGFGAPAGGGFGDPPSAPPAAPSDAWGAPSAAAPGGAPAGWTPGTPLQPAKRSGKSRVVPIVVSIVILAIVVGAVIVNALGPKAVGDLKVGDCFDVPTLASEDDTVDSVQHHPCTESHTGEVIFVGDYTGATDTYPAVSDFDTFVGNTCKPVFQAYVGTDLDSSPDLSIGYFYPLEDGWSNGDRSVTCYAVRDDNGPMTTSVKNSESGGSSPAPAGS